MTLELPGPRMLSRSLLAALLLPLLATIVEFFPGLDELLVYERSTALTTQPWRLFTGHLVHATPRLFAYNVGATLALILACERLLPGIAARSACAALGAVSLLLPFRFDITAYDGLSAAASALGAAVCVGLVLISRRTGERLPALLAFSVTIAFLGKLAYEQIAGAAVFADSGTKPWALAHIVGALAGILVALRSHGSPTVTANAIESTFGHPASTSSHPISENPR